MVALVINLDGSPHKPSDTASDDRIADAMIKFMEIIDKSVYLLAADERFQKEIEEARKLVEQYRIITLAGEADES